MSTDADVHRILLVHIFRIGWHLLKGTELRYGAMRKKSFMSEGLCCTHLIVVQSIQFKNMCLFFRKELTHGVAVEKL